MFKFWKKRKQQNTDKLCDSPYYTYSGPVDTRNEYSQWSDREACKSGRQRTSTGSIHMVHPDMEMLCRLTDNIDLPGFLITCKDKEGNRREAQVYFNSFTNELVVCTDCESNNFLDPDDQIHKRYKVPFEDTSCKGDEK